MPPAGPLALNGFRLNLSTDEFQVSTEPLPDNSTLRELRRANADWFLWWRDGVAYGVPRVDTPSTTFGQPKRVRCDEYLPLIVALIDERLPKKFPAYETFRRRPFKFIGKRDEIVATIAGQLSNAPSLLREFSIRPTFTLEAKIIEPRQSETSVGLFLTISTKWTIKADLAALRAAGVDLTGLYVVLRNPNPDERRLVGQINSITDATVHLRASVDGRTTVAADEVQLEGSRTSFARCLKTILGSQYDRFEQLRQREEAKLLNGPALNALFKQFQDFFHKDPVIRITDELQATIAEQLVIENSADYQSIHHAPAVMYYFDPARTKAHQYPWTGIQQYGPFSKDTFPKRSPNILIVFPDTAQGATETFVRLLRDGITTPSGRSAYSGGFAKLFSLLNPTFSRLKVPLMNGNDPARSYRQAIEEYLAANTAMPDAAIVVLNDQHGTLPDHENPYLVAKATLMLAGVPTQEVRTSRVSKSAYELQYILQNFTVALYAKMNGTPWTVNQDTTISDELIIGLGTSEYSTNRFEKRTRYVGITTVFRGDGNYLLGHVSKECTYDEYPQMLQETTERVLQDIKQRNGWSPGDNIRLIFHAYKPLKNVEVAEIAKRAALAVGQEQHIEFAFLTVTIDHSFLLSIRLKKAYKRNQARRERWYRTAGRSRKSAGSLGWFAPTVQR